MFIRSPSGLILRQEGKIQESLEQFQVIVVVLVTVLLMCLVPGLGLQHPEPQQCRQHQADGPLPVSAGEAQAG